MDDVTRRELEIRLQQMALSFELGSIRAQRTFRKTAESFQRFGMAWAALEISESDLGEFDNRAHDWLRAD